MSCNQECNQGRNCTCGGPTKSDVIVAWTIAIGFVLFLLVYWLKVSN